MSTKKYQITQLQNDDSLLILHPETDADIVSVDNSSGNYGGQATNVQDALEEIYDALATPSVTGVKGDSESTYRTGNVNITKTNIGLGNVTNNAQVKGLASGTTSGHLVKWGADGYTVADTGVAISTDAPSSSSTDAQVPTSRAVYTAIGNIPKPMVFKGTLGNAIVFPTATSLPSPSADTVGWVYKVISNGTYNTGGGSSTAAKTGDLFICRYVVSPPSGAYDWILVPSGDDVEDTWRNIQVNGTELLGNGISSGAINFVNGGNVTVTGSGNNITLGVASGYSIPSTSDQSDWSAKYDLPSGGIPSTDLASAVQTSLGKADSALQSHQTITVSGDATGTSNNGAISLTLANSGVTAGTYSALQVNAKGLATAGGQIIEIGTTSQTTPSSSLVVGGVFFKEV